MCGTYIDNALCQHNAISPIAISVGSHKSPEIDAAGGKEGILDWVGGGHAPFVCAVAVRACRAVSP